MIKTKLLLLGECEQGKSTLANFLSETVAETGQPKTYKPTQGCRIVEFEVKDLKLKSGRKVSCEVEMWDVSGDPRFSGGWPAIAKDTSGIVFVYRTDTNLNAKEMEGWYNNFADKQGLADKQCVIFGNNIDGRTIEPNIPYKMNKIRCTVIDLNNDPEGVRSEFDKFLTDVCISTDEARDSEELKLIN
ncbi:DgyrCDS9410 [Dimorphilus gyrociliatus]|uniref:DgyrCDS9410 n=1 Tax=Dimorphilus gyrociliatus TaxID=2664684 RepID=A0A7I8VYC5_9ANNE|nr:DgyrCDS9410 [Dimorphilus gyrociliatus]